MTRLPHIDYRHRVCIICEGYEEYYYLSKLLDLNVWSKKYEFTLINAKGAPNIFPRYQDAYNNERYEMILIFCDTDKPSSCNHYSLIKRKINNFHDQNDASKQIVIFANPCTMQIVLLHFADVRLRTQAKKVNALLIFQLTGVNQYKAKEEQIKQICSQIYIRTYKEMKERVMSICNSDNQISSTNFGIFLNYFENDDIEWIKDINKNLG